MRTLLRVVVILLGIVVVLVAAAAVILPRVMDPNLYKDRIAALVEERTGRELTIAGDIGWSVFPWLGVELGEVRLANAPGFGADPFVQASAVQVRVKLLPLLRKEVEMSTVLLDGLRVHLAKAKDGRTNWADLVAAKPGSQTPREPGREPKATTTVPAAIAIGGVQVRDARLIWDDQSTGARYTLDKVELTTDTIRQDQPVGVDMRFTAVGTQPAFESDIRLRTQVVPTGNFRQIELRDLSIEAAARGKDLPGGALDAKLQTQLRYAMDRNSLEITDLSLNVLDLRLTGQARGSDIGGAAPRLEGNLRLAAFAPRDVLKKLRIEPPATSDSGALQRAEAETTFAVSAAAAEFSKLAVRVDDTQLTGSMKIENFARPATQFQVAVDRIDLDRYLPPRTPDDGADEADDDEAAPGGDTAGAVGGAKAGKATGPHARKPAPLLPVEILRSLRLNGSVRIGELKAYQIRSKDVEIKISADNGAIRLAPARAQLYQGRYDGNISIDVRGKQPKLGLDEKFSGVQIGALLKDLQGDAKITGKADIELKLTAAGNPPRAIRRTMNGTARFALSDGVVKGMDVLGEIRRAYALLRGKPPAQVQGGTEFTALTGTATIVQGLVTNRDLQGKSPLMQLQGEGTANLVTDALDYRVTATLVDVLEGQGELTGRPIPVRVTGTLAQPKVGVDLQQVLKQEARKQVEKKVQEKLQDNLKDGLKGLLGR